MVTTGFGVEATGLDVENPRRIPSASACERFREAIELGLSRGRDATAIWQDLVVENGFNGGPSDGQAGIGTACLPTIQIGLGSDPIIGLPYAACAKETIHECGRETRMGFCSDVALLCRVPAKVVSIFHAQKKPHLRRHGGEQ